MTDAIDHTIGRRTFLTSAAVGALVVGLRLGPATAAAGDAVLAPNAFIRIGADDTVTVIVKHLEMGQGIETGLASIVADELGAAWRQMRAEAAPADETRYNNLAFGPFQGTGGSTSVANSWAQLRRAAAEARTLLVAAAAAEWAVPAGEIRVADGIVAHPASGRTAPLGALAAKAASLPRPAEVTLRDAPTGVGATAKRLDSPAKVTGAARYAIDIAMPGLLTALVARPPRFWSEAASFAAEPAKAVPGVVDVVEVPSCGGVAVVAKTFWAARNGREALEIVWDEGTAERRDGTSLQDLYRSIANEPGPRARDVGSVETAMRAAAIRHEATFEFPYLAHAPLEPLSCVARVADGRVEIWAGSQLPTSDKLGAAAAAGVDPSRVTIHVLPAGGSFGRRATPDSDMVVQAVEVAKHLNGAPVKLLWTREDDIKGGRYRPMAHHLVAAGLDADGRIQGWVQRIVSQSILKGTAFEFLLENGIDPTIVEGAKELAYEVPNLRVEAWAPTGVGVPVLWWRSVGHSHTAFVVETTMDELAHAARQDPVAFRRRHLAPDSRHLAALDLAATKAGWGATLPPGRGRGVAVHESFGTVVAQIAEVTVSGGEVRVDRVVAAVACGTVINPDIVAAQIEGGVAFGLGAALWGEITLKDGRVEQSNFNDYRVLRMAEMPKVEVHLLPSTASPTGVGEPGVPPIAPAIGNAIFAATGKRLRALPLMPGLAGA